MKENEHTSRSEQRNEQHTNNPEYRRINGLLEAGDEFKAYGGQEVARELVKDPTATMETLRLRLADKLRAMKPTPFATAQPGDTGPSGNSVIPRAFGNARVLSAFGENRRAAEEAAYGVGQWLRAQLTGNAKAEAWCRDHGYAVRAAGGGVNSAGGFLVPIELSSAIVNLVEEYGVARQECRAVTMSSDVINVSVKKSGLTHYYVSENSEITKSDVTWGNLSLTARKLATLSVMSAEVAEDAVIDLASWLAMEAAQAFAEAEDNALFNGDGTSTYGGITGIRTKIIDGTHNAGKVTAGANIDTFAEITTGDLDSLVAALPAYALRGAKFYCSAAFYATVFQRFIEAAGGLTLADMVKGPITKGYMGLPIVTSPKMPASTSTDYSGEAMLLFGNMDQAVLFGSRREVRVKVDESRYLEFDQIAVQVTERYDVNAHGLGDNTTAGPMVGLIGN